MSSSPPFAAPTTEGDPPGPPPAPGSWAPASAMWRGWPEVRADLRSSVLLVLALALAGVPAGLLWWALAPRADFRVTDAGPEAIGQVSGELLVADDAVYALVLLGVGLLAGAAAWFLRRRRGVATVLALALGSCAAAVVAWQVGELLGAGPSEAELAQVGARVTTSLTLGSPPAMALAPFGALLAYVAAVLYARDDGLGRTAEASPARTDQPTVS
ncbi:LPXTG cell wall anchor domain-containing protein [Blastococcus litoris]|uniref:LPXTG cell wall anchor domain-containing protein n=1 Tax=Blastococcus litoris TaxID=2171622 RepID=UPI0013DFCCC2|nr:LPXTG cell wall anchor domain-containing protein [Blastococcus litoris]